MPKGALYIILLLVACQSRRAYPPGGYDYPETLTGNDTNYYYYPVRAHQSRRDSFLDAFASIFYKAIDEPNISLLPLPSPLYRLWYQGYYQRQYLISLTKEYITVKEIYHDTSSEKTPWQLSTLDSIGKKHRNLLYRFFPLDDTSRHLDPRRRHYLDSIGHVYPRLYDPAYFRELLEKDGYTYTGDIRFTVKKVKIDPETFNHLRQAIDTSGFWSLLPKPDHPDVADAAGFVFEANTPFKYNMVESCFCGGEPLDRVEKVFDELIRKAGIYDQIHPPCDTTRRPPAIVQDVQLEEVKKDKPRRRRHQNVSPKLK